jgi:hypothetical protein
MKDVSVECFVVLVVGILDSYGYGQLNSIPVDPRRVRIIDTGVIESSDSERLKGERRKEKEGRVDQKMLVVD